MTGPHGVGEWIVFCFAMTGLGLLSLMIAFMGILAVILMCQLAYDIWRHGL